MEVAHVVTVNTGEAHLVVDVLGKPDRSHELSGIACTVTCVAGLVHRRGAEEAVLVDQATGIAVRTADVTLSTGGVTVHAVEVEDLPESLVYVVKGIGITGKVNEGVGKAPHRVVQRLGIGLSGLQVTLGTDSSRIGGRCGIDPDVGVCETTLITIAAMTGYTAQLTVGGGQELSGNQEFFKRRKLRRSRGSPSCLCCCSDRGSEVVDRTDLGVTGDTLAAWL